MCVEKRICISCYTDFIISMMELVFNNFIATIWFKIVLFFYHPQMIFYIQDSDDIYGRFGFHPRERQSIQSQPEGRFLSLSFLREAGTLGEVRLAFSALYIPAGTLDPARARDGVLNGTSANSLLFSSGQSRAQVILPIRNDAFLQNGARFLIQVLSQQTANHVKTWSSTPVFCMALAFNLFAYSPCLYVLSFLNT